MYIPQKGGKNVKNGNKQPKIANNCKISEINKYGEKMPKIDNNVKKCQKRAKNGQKMAKFKNKKCRRFSGLKLPQQIDETAKNGFKCFKMH